MKLTFKSIKQTKVTKKEGGFTIVELLVVCLLFILILGVGTSVMISTVTSSNKSEMVNKAKQNGSRALEVMEKEIRSAQSIIFPGPNSTSNRLIFLNSAGQYIEYSLEPAAPATGVNQAIWREEYTDSSLSAETSASNLAVTDRSGDGITVINLAFQVDASQKNVKISFDINRSTNTLPGLIQFNLQNVEFDSSVSLRN